MVQTAPAEYHIQHSVDAAAMLRRARSDHLELEDRYAELFFAVEKMLQKLPESEIVMLLAHDHPPIIQEILARSLDEKQKGN